MQKRIPNRHRVRWTRRSCKHLRIRFGDGGDERDEIYLYGGGASDDRPEFMASETK